jgi:hypothetical protein
VTLSWSFFHAEQAMVCLVLGLFLLRRRGIHLESQSITLQEELQKEEKVTDIHDQNTGIVFKGSPTSFSTHNQKGSHGNKGPNHHLCYLSNGNPFGIEPFGFAFDGHKKVIEIHDSMNSVVDGTVDQSWRTMCDKGVPGAKKNRDMMIPVQEHQLLFMGHNKIGIKEFPVDIDREIDIVDKIKRGKDELVRGEKRNALVYKVWIVHSVVVELEMHDDDHGSNREKVLLTLVC